MSDGRFLNFGPPRPHECVFPDAVPTGVVGPDPEIPWPSSWRIPRTGDKWQCGTCARVYRYKDGGLFRDGRWRFVMDPGYQLMVVPVTNPTGSPTE